MSHQPKPKSRSFRFELPRLFPRGSAAAASPAAPGPEEVPAEPVCGITCTDYSPAKFESFCLVNLDDLQEQHRPDWSGVRWVDVEGLGDTDRVRAVAAKYRLHPLAVEDILLGNQRAKVEDYPASEDQPGRLFIMGYFMGRRGETVEPLPLAISLGRSTLLSFRRGGDEIVHNLMTRLNVPTSRVRNGDASFLLYRLLDEMVDSYFPILEGISSRLEDLQDEVEAAQSTRLLPRLYHLKRDLIVMRRYAWPMRDVINELLRDRHECFSEETHTHLRDVSDHLVLILDLLETYREFANSLAEMHMSAISNRMNDIMKTLTIISTIFVPLTFLAGVYGMNMPIPENKSPWTYAVFWGVCLIVGVGMVAWFRRRRWI